MIYQYNGIYALFPFPRWRLVLPFNPTKLKKKNNNKKKSMNIAKRE